MRVSSPALLNLIRMVKIFSRGSAADSPMSLPALVRMMVRFTPADSPMTMKDADGSELYRDLSTPRLRAGGPAFAFELPRLDLSGGTERDTGERVRLADYLGVRPVALIFGSYT